MSINANLEACSDKSALNCSGGVISLKTRKYEETLPVETTILAAFGCAEFVEVIN